MMFNAEIVLPVLPHIISYFNIIVESYTTWPLINISNKAEGETIVALDHDIKQLFLH